MKTIEAYDLIYSIVSSIPRGRVATYGQVAELAGLSRGARQVGFALRVLPDGSGIPWHRVINSRGEISPRGEPEGEHEQRLLLESEGIVFNEGGRLSLRQFRWDPEVDGY